jgi:hypothetical protein
LKQRHPAFYFRQGENNETTFSNNKPLVYRAGDRQFERPCVGFGWLGYRGKKGGLALTA